MFLSFFFFFQTITIWSPNQPVLFFFGLTKNFLLYVFVNKPERHLRKSLKALGVKSQDCLDSQLLLLDEMTQCVEATCPIASAYWVNQDQTAVIFWLTNNAELADTEKNEQTESTSEKGDYLDLWMLPSWNAQTAQMTTSYSYRGFYFISDTGLDRVMFPLLLCHPSRVAALP